MLSHILKDSAPELTGGIAAVVLLSCLLFAVKTHFGLTEVFLSVGASVFDGGHVHKVLTYPFYHRTFTSLLTNVGVLVLLGGSFEKSVGTVRFLFLFLLLSTSTGLCYAFLDLLQNGATQSHAEGLVPVALAIVAVTTMRTRMAKAFFFGVNIPTMSLPWIFLLIVTILIPNAVLPCNIVAILVGWMYGKGWFSVLDMSEARASVLEKLPPFRYLKNVHGVSCIPSNTEERRKTLLPQINPTPGSYPVQAYAPLSSINAMDPHHKTYEGWPNASSVTGPISPFTPQGCGSEQSSGKTQGHTPEQSFGHSCNHNHPHSHGHL